MTTIMIVDDDQQIRKLLTMFLEDAGYTTLTAGNGIEGIERFKETRPEIIITDILMPEKEGIETILELKKIDSEVKIIAISGGGKISPKSYLSMAKTFGATATIQKPIYKEDLLSVVRGLLVANDTEGRTAP